MRRFQPSALLMFAALFGGWSAAEAQTVEWIDQFGGAAIEQAIGVSAQDDRVAIGGGSEGALPGQVHLGGEDAFVRVYAPDGTLLWTRQFGTASNERVNRLAFDGSGNVYAAGETWGSLAAVNQGGVDAFLRKFDANGNVVWTVQFGTASHDMTTFIAADDQTFVVTGTTQGTLPGQTALGGWDVFVRKYDLGGVEQWTRQFGTASDDGAGKPAIDVDGNVYVSGLVRGALAAQTHAGMMDAFIRKYDSSGTELWTRQIGTAQDDFAIGAAIDASGNPYVAGETMGTLPGFVSAGSWDAFVRSYTADGVERWTRQFGTAEQDWALAAGGTTPGVIVGGTVGNGATGGALPGQTAAGKADLYVRWYDTAGTEIATLQIGSSGMDVLNDLAVGGGVVYVSGTVYDSGALPGESSGGAGDAYVLKMTMPAAVDSTPPVLTLPSTITAEATSALGAEVVYGASAHDEVDGPVPIDCAPASGSVFPLGTTSVICSATDSSGNTAEASFEVIVQDTMGPTLTVPGNISTTATSGPGAIITFDSSALDLVDGSVPISCTPGSGSTFPLGTTTVTCTSTDGRGNTAFGSFAVTVNPAVVSFHAPAAFQAGVSPTAIAVADFNGDGRLDIVTADYGPWTPGAGISVFLGNGDGTLAARTQYVLSSTVTPRSVATGDFNQDGHADFAVGDHDAARVGVFLGNGAGGFTRTELDAPKWGAMWIATGDLNADGRLDFAMANHYTHDVSIYLNNTAAGASAASFARSDISSGGSNASTVTIGDVDGNGRLDLVISNGNNVTQRLGNGDGTFAAATTLLSYVGAAAVLHDADRDGALDLVVVAGAAIEVLLGNGDGSFAAPMAHSVDDPATAAVERVVFRPVVADLNGDGVSDIAIAVDSGDIAVLLGHGNGTFATATFADADGAGALAAGHFNGDSRLDVAMTAANHRVAVMLNASSDGVPTGISLSASPEAPVYGEAITITATVTGGVVTDGTVTFRAGEVVLAGPVPLDAAGQAAAVLTGLNAGAHTIAAEYSGSGAFLPSAAVVTLTIAKADQTIAFGPLADKKDVDRDLSLSATASSGLPVEFAASGACSVTGTVVDLLGPGTCSITASQPGDGNYNAAAPVVQTFTIADTTPPIGEFVIPIQDAVAHVSPSFTRIRARDAHGVSSVRVNDATASLVSGTAQDGIWEASVAVTIAGPNTFTGEVTDFSGNRTVVTRFIDGDGISALIDRNLSTLADETGVYSSAYVHGPTRGTIVDRAGWIVRLRPTDRSGPVRIFIQAPDGATALRAARVQVCHGSAYKELRLDVVGETAIVSCDEAGTLDVLAERADPRIDVVKDVCRIFGGCRLHVVASLATGQRVATGSPFTNLSTEPMLIQILDETGGVVGFLTLDSGESADLETEVGTDGRERVYVTVLHGSVDVTLSGITTTVTPGAPAAFVHDTEPPVIEAVDITAEATSADGAIVEFAPVVWDFVDPKPTVALSPRSGTRFPLGATPVTVTATDVAGNSASATFTVTVVDTTPPAITGLSVDTPVLWPPNHTMVDVAVAYTATDAVTALPICSLDVQSNEPVNGTGDGDTAPDWEVLDAHRVRLRAERAGSGSGRIYTIAVTCADVKGNAATSHVTVSVPRSQGETGGGSANGPGESSRGAPGRGRAR